MSRINLQNIQSTLKSSVIGRNIVYLDTAVSTMDVAHSHASSPKNNGLLVLSEEQSSGRGRFARNWISPRYQNLYLSVLLYGDADILKYMSIAACLAVSKAIENLTPLTIELNWPNDLTVKGKKLGGILVEQVHSIEKLSYGVIGIGLNVNMDTSRYPEIAESATSLQMELGRPFSRELMLVEILEMLEHEQAMIKANISPVPEWKQKLVTLGSRITLKESAVEHTGKAVNVDENGNLVMQLDDDSYITMASGDVTSHRSA